MQVAAPRKGVNWRAFPIMAVARSNALVVALCGFESRRVHQVKDA